MSSESRKAAMSNSFVAAVLSLEWLFNNITSSIAALPPYVCSAQKYIQVAGNAKREMAICVPLGEP